MDDLKEINRSFGYQAGDQAIINVANCIMHHVRKSDLVSHWGGDEFAVLLYESSLSDVKRIARRILAQINQIGFSISIGIGDSIETAQFNQQTAKTMGKNQISIFNKSQSIQILSHAQLSHFPTGCQLKIEP